MNPNIPNDETKVITRLIESTADALRAASGNEHELEESVARFYKDASTAHLNTDQIENILGINDGCIMDLAQLSEEDEEIVISMFETLSSK